MAFHNPTGRVNYEPNSWGEGPREDPVRSFRSFPAPVEGPRQRERSESFADHYSQARQFYRSQTDVEQTHIRDAYVFELSKVDHPAIRERMVGHLVLVDETLARGVAEGLGLPELPDPPEPAAPVIDLPPSPALSILRNGPGSFRGRKLGVLAGDGADAWLLDALADAAWEAGAVVELIAAKIGGVTDSAGVLRPAAKAVKGGPSVLFDAVALVFAETGTVPLLSEPSACSFVSDAFAQAKFIGFTVGAGPLLARAGVTPDAGCVLLDTPGSAGEFIELCAGLRHWDRVADPVS